MGQFDANWAKLLAARGASSGFSRNKSCSPERPAGNKRVPGEPNVPAARPPGFAGRCPAVASAFAGSWRMKKHKRDGASSMESARSAAGSWCSQSRPQIGFIGSPERRWSKTLKVSRCAARTTCGDAFLLTGRVAFVRRSRTFLEKGGSFIPGRADISLVFFWRSGVTAEPGEITPPGLFFFLFSFLGVCARV